MFRRTFTVVYKPAKNNYVILPDAYFRLINSYEKGCLNLSFENKSHHISWAPYSSNVHEYEIGINGMVAKALGLKEGSLVKCSLVADVLGLYSVTATTLNKTDWELLEMSSNRIQTTLLDQTKIINETQNLVVWINTSIYITLKIEKLSPKLSFGKLENNTEIIIAPFKTPPSTPVPVVKRIPTVSTLSKSPSSSTRPTSFIGTNKPNSTILNKITDNKEKPTNNYKLAHCQSELIPNVSKKLTKSEEKFQTRLQQLEEMTSLLEKEAPKAYEFRIVKCNWGEDKCNGQISDLFVERGSGEIEEYNYSQIFMLKTNSDREYYVNVKTLNRNKFFTKTVYPTIEMNDVLMNILKLEPFEKIQIKPKNSIVNLVEKIELIPNKSVPYKTLKEIEENFKEFIIENSKLFPILINQKQIFKLKNDVYVTVNLFPESCKFCAVDGNILREARIQVLDDSKDIDEILKSGKNGNEEKLFEEQNFVRIDKFDKICEEVMERLKINLCLDERNKLRKMENILLVGSYNSGKTVLCSKILQELSQPPFNCYFDIFFCSRNKGRKPDSIQKDLRQIFTQCMNFNPSILLLDNLDMLAHATGEHHNQESDYFNKISNIIQSLLIEFTPNNAISVIATVSSVSNLNKKIYQSRGRHIFQSIITIPNLENNDREFIIKELCRKCKFGKTLNWRKFSNLTEGYKIGDLVQFVDRALFYAFRNDLHSPMLTNDVFVESLKTTNNYCLVGIENHNSNNNNNESIDDEDNENSDSNNLNEIAGMGNVIEVLEEVLIWPSKFPNLYSNSPLKNQAGVLLFGPPGTGKTYLISQIAKKWNLRMISVKGPELLAKYIGQSEENVRNLFNKARSARPCVLFFDEFDSLAPRRGHDSTGVTDRVVNQLLTELDGVEGLQGVTVVAATSRPELLDPALLRSGRIDRLVECNIPDNISREQIFEYLSKTLSFDKSVNIKLFSTKMENYTGADIQSLLTTANMAAVKECLNKDPQNVPDKITITQSHLQEAFETTRPSLSKSDIAKYKRIYSKFTNKEKSADDFNFVAKRATLA